MDKKVVGGIVIVGLLTFSFIGFYLIPTYQTGSNQQQTGSMIGLILIFQQPSPEKWAFIVASSHTFYDSDETSGITPNPNFTNPTGPEWYRIYLNGTPKIEWDPSENQAGTPPGCINITTTEANQSGQWEVRINNDILEIGMGYTLDVWVKNITPITGKVSIGFNWTENFDSTNPLHWSWDGATVKNPTGNWQEFIIHSQCPEYADVPTGGCKVVLGYEQTGIGSGSVFFDTVIINATVPLNGTGPPPTQTGADGFVAQAIQAYWALKNHSYDDDHIFLMINAGDRDVRVWTPATNDFLYTEPYIDVNGTDVNSSRFVKELNISISGSWASRIRSNDELLLYMIDHGSNNVDPTKNATFHFDAGTFVTEQELDSLLDKIICKRMILMFDMCFAGNFMQPFLNASANRVLIGSSAPPKLSWYWISASINHFAGSFFFHPFWDTLNQTGKTLMDAITAGANHWPFNHLQPVSVIQGPISPGQSYIDNVGILNSWTL